MRQPRPLFCFNFQSFQMHILQEKAIGFSGIRNHIVGVEGEHADDHGTTFLFNSAKRLCLDFTSFFSEEATTIVEICVWLYLLAPWRPSTYIHTLKKLEHLLSSLSLSLSLSVCLPLCVSNAVMCRSGPCKVQPTDPLTDLNSETKRNSSDGDGDGVVVDVDVDHHHHSLPSYKWRK